MEKIVNFEKPKTTKPEKVKPSKTKIERELTANEITLLDMICLNKMKEDVLQYILYTKVDAGFDEETRELRTRESEKMFQQLDFATNQYFGYITLLPRYSDFIDYKTTIFKIYEDEKTIVIDPPDSHRGELFVGTICDVLDELVDRIKLQEKK